MKKFLMSMAVSITCITIGFTSMLFELRTFEIVELEYDEAVNKQTVEVTEALLRNDKIRILLEDSYLYVDIQEDLEKSDEIVIQYPLHVNTQIKNNKIYLEGYEHFNHSYRYFNSMFDRFVEGWKDRKIYVNVNGFSNNRIIIHCSPEIGRKIHVEYD
ncbi:MAG: hypothetical protein HFG16_03680 [Erysipelotrichaceae bacterium]|nr:hypothetical protein [Erysipelotrichaceae bacterium]